MAVTYPVYLQAVTVTTGVNDTIVFDEGSGALTATIAAGTYFLRGDGAADDLALAIKTAMDAAGGSYSLNTYGQIATGFYFLEISGTDCFFDIAASTFDVAGLLGMTSANETIASQHDLKVQINWNSSQPLAGKETSNQSNVSQYMTAEGQVHTYVGQDGLVSRLLEHELVNAHKTKRAIGANASFETWWGRARTGVRFEYHEVALQSSTGLADTTSATLQDTLILGQDACNAFTPARLSRGLALYSWSLDCRRYVA